MNTTAQAANFAKLKHLRHLQCFWPQLDPLHKTCNKRQTRLVGGLRRHVEPPEKRGHTNQHKRKKDLSSDKIVAITVFQYRSVKVIITERSMMAAGSINAAQHQSHAHRLIKEKGSQYTLLIMSHHIKFNDELKLEVISMCTCTMHADQESCLEREKKD